MSFPNVLGRRKSGAGSPTSSACAVPTVTDASARAARTPRNTRSLILMRTSLLWRSTIEQDRPRLDALDVQQLGFAPRIGGEARSEDLLAGRIDDEQDLFAKTQRAAQYDEPLGGERIHGDRVLRPLSLLAHRHRGIPGAPPNPSHREPRHHYVLDSR